MALFGPGNTLCPTESLKMETGEDDEDAVDDSLKCPVCLIIPRTSPVFSCLNGHIICSKCRQKLASCPLCRAEIQYRNVFAERLFARLLEHRILTCENLHLGCDYKSGLKEILAHAPICDFREVHCPGSHRKSCLKLSPLARLIQHLSTDKCAQVIHTLLSCSATNLTAPTF